MNRIVPHGFWFLRHGQTDWNARDLAQGNVETCLNATGLAQAEAAAVKLRQRGIGRIVSSPLMRARETAEVVGEALGIVPVYDPDLREAAYGIEEGKVMSLWFDEWVAGRFTPEGAESFEALMERAARGINRHLEPQGEGPVLVVAHGALFRAVRAVMGLPRDVRTPNATPFWCDQAEGEWRLTAV
jgi:broad specificity phosphatase PhoE